MDTPLGKGIFLIATPSLREPSFRQTVVLLCEHGEQGALGVVVNRPTKMNITEVLPQVPILEGQNHMVFEGGPVQRNHLLMLFKTLECPEDTHYVFDGVYLGSNMTVLEDILKNPFGPDNFRAFMGYSGWAPGQLEYEMETGSWLTLPADTSFMFDRDHTRLWGEILRSLGGQYQIYGDMPPDPQMN